MRRSPARRSAAALVATLLLLPACSDGDDGTEPQDQGETAADVLARAKETLDRSPSVHFTLTSENVPTDGTRLIGGEGVVARPNSFRGDLALLLDGNKVTVALVSTGGTVYAKLPFAKDFAVTNPAAFGLSDPAELIDAETGISRIAAQMTRAQIAGEARAGADVVVDVTGEVPGLLIDELLTSADPVQPVQARLSVVKDSGELRRAVLTGPFFEKGRDSTFTVVLDQYGEQVTISAPPTG